MSGLMGVRVAAVGLLTLGLVVQACGDSGSNGGGGPGNNGGESSEAGAATGDAGSDSTPGGGNTNTGGSSPDAGGEGGGGIVIVPVVEKPRSGFAMVVDGTVATSDSFRVILTLGESPSGNTTMKSSQHRVDLGVIGSTQ